MANVDWVGVCMTVDLTIDNADVQEVLASYPLAIQQKLLFVRQLIFDVASELDGVGTIEETLKWGQMSYLTHQPKSGTTIRIDRYHSESEQVALFVHCKTTLVDRFRDMYPNMFAYEGTRAVIFDVLDDDQIEALKHCVELALTYHLRKR